MTDSDGGTAEIRKAYRASREKSGEEEVEAPLLLVLSFSSASSRSGNSTHSCHQGSGESKGWVRAKLRHAVRW